VGGGGKKWGRGGGDSAGCDLEWGKKRGAVRRGESLLDRSYVCRCAEDEGKRKAIKMTSNSACGANTVGRKKGDNIC